MGVLPHPVQESTPDLPAIKALAKTLFDALAEEEFANIAIQSFDEDFDEWIDLNDSFVAQHKQKLKVVLSSSLKQPARVCIYRMHECSLAIQ